MLDEDLAALYGVTTARLNEQVKRNADRFPADFAFRLTPGEWDALMSQIATSNDRRSAGIGRGGRRKRPNVFIEHGAVMLATVLNSPRAVRASLEIVRAFVRLREILATHRDLAEKIAELEARYDGQFQEVFAVLRQLIEGGRKPRKRIGFEQPSKGTRSRRKS